MHKVVVVFPLAHLQNPREEIGHPPIKGNIFRGCSTEILCLLNKGLMVSLLGYQEKHHLLTFDLDARFVITV